ncbi:P-selectin-like [Clavelina lepadiformis]|uniref:P-selectin-like n=1 Tax=Clavelina lepadiformis TaxID=159417 RepID=UPI004041810C
MLKIVFFGLFVVSTSAQSFLDILTRNQCFGLPPRPINGRYKLLGSSYARTASYECNDCFKMTRGLPYNTCSNRRWVNPAPICEREDPCQNRRRPCDYTAECISLGLGRYTCQCKSGYSGDGKRSYFRDSCSTYVRSGTSRKSGCKRACKRPFQWSNADYTPRQDSYEEFERIYWTCISPYKQRSTSGSTAPVSQFCYFGHWSGTSPTCLLSLCDDPVAPGNGTIRPSKRLTWNKGNAVTYGCNEGFELVGNATVTCEAASSFANPPTCAPVAEGSG